MNLTTRELNLLSILEPRLHAAAQRLSRSNPRVDADDALQTGRLAVLENLCRLNQDLPEESHLAFLSTTAMWRMKDLSYDACGIHCPTSQRAERNKARTTLAKGGDVDVEQRTSLGALLSLFQSLDDPTQKEIGASLVDEIESEMFVKMLLGKLPEEDANAFALVFLCEYSYDEAAQMLGMTNATLRSRLRAAKRVLASELLTV